MKIISLLIGACLLQVLTGCQKPSNVIGRAETTIKSTALAAIATRYPDVSSSQLKFSELTVRAKSNGQENVYVVYTLPASAKTTTEGKKATTTTDTINVRMSLSEQVEMVYKSSRNDIYDIAQ